MMALSYTRSMVQCAITKLLSSLSARAVRDPGEFICKVFVAELKCPFSPRDSSSSSEVAVR